MTSDNDRPELDEGVTEVGYVRVSVILGPEGVGTAFTMEGVSAEAAIGHLIIVTDRIREEKALCWHGDEIELELEELDCPHCGNSLLLDEDEEEEDEDG